MKVRSGSGHLMTATDLDAAFLDFKPALARGLVRQSTARTCAEFRSEPEQIREERPAFNLHYRRVSSGL
jgi:hypothetical protein